MAIFASDNQQSNGGAVKGGAATIIAQGTKIKGDISTDCHLHIDGELNGVIHSKNTVMVGKTGLLEGEVFANKLIVGGKFHGSTESDIVEILPGGRFEGTLSASELVIEKKGIFIGESKSKDQTKAPKLESKNDSSKSL